MALVDVARERADVGSGAVGAVNEPVVGVHIGRDNVEMLGSGHKEWSGGGRVHVAERRCSPPEAHLNTGRLCSAGSGANRSPASTLVCSPPTPSLPSAAALVSLARGLPWRGRFFFAEPLTWRRPAVRASTAHGASESD